MNDVKTLQSLGCYLGMVLLVGQLGLRAVGVPFDKLFLLISGILVLAPMFGPDFVVAVIQAVRGGGRGRGHDDRTGGADERL